MPNLCLTRPARAGLSAAFAGLPIPSAMLAGLLTISAAPPGRG
jgi:hypothetical protein